MESLSSFCHFSSPLFVTLSYQIIKEPGFRRWISSLKCLTKYCSFSGSLIVFSTFKSQPSNLYNIQISTSALTTATIALVLSKISSQICSPSFHSVINVPKILTPFLWAIFVQHKGGMVIKWWLKYTNTSICDHR